MTAGPTQSQAPHAAAPPPKLPREVALRKAERKKAARRRRTGRIRRGVAVLSVGAFIGPFGVIFTQLALGRDPALTTNHKVAAKPSVASASSPSVTSSSTVQTTSPTPVTTQQS